MLYVIVCLINNDTYDFHEKLVSNVCNIYNVKRQKLQSHFTIKAPFETDSIEIIEDITEEFCESNTKSSFEMDGYDHFKDRVVFMKISASKEMKEVCSNYISDLKKIPWLEWKLNEKGSRLYHCTIVSKLPRGKFKDIWDYVNCYPYKFKCSFDNITIMKWVNNEWIVHKSFSL